MKKLLGIVASLALLGPAGMVRADQAGSANLNKNNMPGAGRGIVFQGKNTTGAGLGKGTGTGANAKGKGNFNLAPNTGKIHKIQTRSGNNPGRGVTTGGVNQAGLPLAGVDLVKPRFKPVTSGSWNPNNNKAKPKNGPVTNPGNPDNHSGNPPGGPATGGGNPLGESSSN